jgi:hypothetical protein
MQWEFESALLGFMQLINVHNGKHLDGALIKILDHVGIAHKVHVFDFLIYLMCCC